MFPARQSAFCIDLLLLALPSTQRPVEARDAARMAFRNPWWTLGVPYKSLADLAGFGEKASGEMMGAPEISSASGSPLGVWRDLISLRRASSPCPQPVDWVQQRLTEEAAANDIQQGKAPQQVAIDQAALLMDRVASGLDGDDGTEWDRARPELVAK